MTKKNKNLVYGILLLVFLLVFIISGVVLIKGILGYVQAGDNYQTVVDSAVVMPDVPKDLPNSEVFEQPEPPITVDFDALLQENPDTVGWIYSPSTKINYPVVQAEDNDYYLKHLFNGTTNAAGAIFMEYKNSPDTSDRHTLLYGHHMKDGSMFASLVKYEEQAYFDENPTMFYSTPTQDYVVELVAGYLTDAYESIPITFTSGATFVDYVNALKSVSLFDSPVVVEEDDKVLSLYTCAYDYSEARYIVVGKLTPWEEYVGASDE